MYLTRFRFNTARMGARRLLSSPQSMHAAVLHGFPEPGSPDDGQGRILWRLDRGARHEAMLYIASPEAPDLTHLVEQGGWPERPSGKGWDTRPYGKLLTTLEPGQRWAFRLTANPVRWARREPGKPKQRLAHVTPAQQIEWLLSRCAERGFTVAEKSDGSLNLEVRDSTWTRFVKDESRRVAIKSATFEGVLHVGDAEALRRTLVRGIGKAKAYGCGMLTLAPIPDGRQ